MNCLGMPLGGNSKSLLFWNPVEEKISSKLSKRKRNSLLSWGKTSKLMQYSLSIPIYFLSISQCHGKVLENIEIGFVISFGKELRKKVEVNW